MPLSDHEQRLLEQMERALYQEDPKFASSLRSGRSGGIDRTRVAVGVLGVVLGLLTVVVGVAVSVPIVGVIGFALMIAGAFWGWTGMRATGSEGNSGAEGPAAPPAGPAPKHSNVGQSSAFMSKMEERWRKRREGGGNGRL